jgi:ankyrin repeat protein
MSALHWAVCLNLHDLVRLLLEQKDINYDLLDHKNQTAIQRAIKNGNSDLMGIFIERRAFNKTKFRDYLLEAIKSSNLDIVR